MSLSRNEQRRLAELDEQLAGELDLIALVALFPLPARVPGTRLWPPVCGALGRNPVGRVVVALVAVAASVGVACALAAVHSVFATAAGTVFGLLAVLMLFLVLLRWARSTG